VTGRVPDTVEKPQRLDNLTLARKEGWQRFVSTPARIPPEQLTRTELEALGENAYEDYNRQRREWHANLGTIKTPQLAALHEDLWDIIDSNLQDGDKAKGAVAIDAFPGLGKTTSVLAFARDYHRREIATHGSQTAAGHERWPVCRVGLTGNTGMLDFNRAMLSFFAHPGVSRGNAAQFAHRAMDCVLACDSRVLIVDDLHFLRWRNTSGVEISNHFKYIANEFPVTLIFVGVGLAARGLFSEGATYEDAVIAQTGRRTTQLDMRPFTVDTDEGRREWRQLTREADSDGRGAGRKERGRALVHRVPNRLDVRAMERVKHTEVPRAHFRRGRLARQSGCPHRRSQLNRLHGLGCVRRRRPGRCHLAPPRGCFRRAAAMVREQAA
jgi:hypothetical protein